MHFIFIDLAVFPFFFFFYYKSEHNSVIEVWTHFEAAVQHINHYAMKIPQIILVQLKI